MFAVLGEIEFQVLSSPHSFERRKPVDYAEHKIVEGKPRLQATGDGLEILTFEMLFHASFVNPDDQLAALEAAAGDHRARALVFGNGVHRGYFVISEISETAIASAADGTRIAARATVTLKEWAPDSQLTDPAAPPKPATPPLAVVPGPAGGGPGTPAIGAPTVFPTPGINAPETAEPTPVPNGYGLNSAGQIVPLDQINQAPAIIAPPGMSAITNVAPPASAPPTLMPSDVPANEIVGS